VDMEMDEVGVGGRHGCASQDPAAKCSRRNAGRAPWRRASAHAAWLGGLCIFWINI
jgi:hypothetical protein